MLTPEIKDKITYIFNNQKALDADSIFNSLSYLPGRAWIQQTGESVLPFERLKMYEMQLKEIRDWDQTKYDYIHKGTPYYFAGVLAFDIEDFDRAVFYFDAALSEDIKNKPETNVFHWTNSAAYGLYTLNDRYGNEIVDHPVSIIKTMLEESITKYNNDFSSNLSLSDLITKFIKPNLKTSGYRVIIPSLYTFISEHDQRKTQVKIRSTEGGTQEPFIVHLFKGCLLYESLLKQIFPQHLHQELGKLLNIVQTDIGYCLTNKDLIGQTAQYSKDLKGVVTGVLPHLDGATSTDRSITVTYRVRNISCHNIVWQEQFTPEIYEILYNSILMSILDLIYKKF